MEDIVIKCNDGKEYFVTYLVRPELKSLVDHRVFEEDFRQAQFTLMALQRGTVFALEHGLTCPADFKNAVKKIQNFKTYRGE